MPYAFEYKKIPLPKNKDRRRKLSDSQREEIKDKYATGNYSIHSLAKEYNVSRRLIQFTLFPERLERAKEIYKKNSAGGRYYNKEKNTIRKRNYRRYKQQVLKELKELKEKGLS